MKGGPELEDCDSKDEAMLHLAMVILAMRELELEGLLSPPPARVNVEGLKQTARGLMAAGHVMRPECIPKAIGTLWMTAAERGHPVPPERELAVALDLVRQRIAAGVDLK